MAQNPPGVSRQKFSGVLWNLVFFFYSNHPTFYILGLFLYGAPSVTLSEERQHLTFHALGLFLYGDPLCDAL